MKRSNSSKKAVPQTVLHVINHTHWDREWFVPFTVTSRWIPNLIRNLEPVVRQNPDYNFLFDAQTMVIEDLEVTDKATYALACRLIENHNLNIGPYYAQLEMRNPGAESLVRNMRIGIDKTRALGGSTDFTAWNVDTFGHISQSPQLHALFGIHNVYAWRGPNELAPFFWWTGADGTKMFMIDLFAGGYRNFYKVTSIDHLAMPRLQHEARKLRPFYPQGHIPVFDGFDLDKEPGDAASYFARHHVKRLTKDNIQVINSSPYRFAETMRDIQKDAPTLSGELISGKYSSVFPGTLSARVYSKLLATHTEQLLYRYAEPISLLLPPDRYPEQLFEDQTKLILQNLVHDVISGCSIDQVHDYAELRAMQVDNTLKRTVQTALEEIAANLTDGTYAFTPATGPTLTTIAHGDQLYEVVGNAVGIAKAIPRHSLQASKRKVADFTWENAHYSAALQSGGVVKLGDGQFGELVIRPDDGDTYWEEPRGKATALKITSPLRVEREAPGYTEVSFTASTKTDTYSAEVQIRLIFDQSPVIRWQLILQTTGTGFSVALRHRYGRPLSKLNVGMQFDNVERDPEDTNLLGHELDPSLQQVLIGQRDTVQTFTFPFHNYVTPADNPDNVHLLAKGLRAYQTEQPGYIDLVLSRPTEWVMKPGLHKYHAGDAGPKFLVPGARAERQTTIECALLVDPSGPDDIRFHRAVDAFSNPPLLFQVQNSKGTQTRIQLFNEATPFSALHQYQGQRIARVFNPTTQTVALRQKWSHLISDSLTAGELSELSPKRIAVLRLPTSIQTSKPAASTPSVMLLNWPTYPVGPDKSRLDPKSLTALQDIQTRLQHKQDTLKAKIDTLGDTVPNTLLHHYYVTARECMEAKLSLKWNDLRAKAESPLKNPYAIDEELYQMATEYNDMRIIRRMYDYIVGVDVSHSEDTPSVRSVESA